MTAETPQPTALATTDQDRITAKQLLVAFALLFVLNLLLRAFYLRFDFVNGDESIRALTAVRVLEGARLYADIVTDKPPATTLFYAAVFALFGRSMTAVHLATAVWNFATAVVLYRIAARFCGQRAGLWAGLLMVYFSTNYLTQDMMAANTEILMALPYSAALYYFAKASLPTRRTDGQTWAALLLAGALTGVATLFKQVGIVNLAFFALHEIVAIYLMKDDELGRRTGQRSQALRQSAARLLIAFAGFGAVIGLFLLWLISEQTLADFWRNAIVLNRHYVGSVPRSLWLKFMTGRTVSYIFFNGALWWLAIWTGVRAIKSLRHHRRAQLIEDDARAGDTAAEELPTPDLLPSERQFNVALIVWAIVSLGAIFTGGRFFGHYFFQVLPALCLLAAQSAVWLQKRLRHSEPRRAPRLMAAALISLFVIGCVRFHQRTAILAYEMLTGRRTRFSQEWGMTKREQEAEVVSNFVRGRLQEGEALFIWDYALDVYWRTGCRPAARYLAPYYITGKFTDAGDQIASPADPFWQPARAHLIEDLQRERPRLILDVFGTLLELPYAELTTFIKQHYRYEGKVTGDSWRPFFVYVLKETDE